MDKVLEEARTKVDTKIEEFKSIDGTGPQSEVSEVFAVFKT
jgi:hypothetical protein